MIDPQTRRNFLTSSGITVAAVIGQRAIAQPGAPKPPVPPNGVIPLGIRQNVADMGEDHPVLKSYRKAVETMKKLDAKNPLSWAFQANMHGIPAGEGENAGWKWCMHGNWWFLPWHRGYLYFFEKIVRKQSGDETFRLPYWAWDQPGHNALPAPFRNAKYAGAENTLFDGTRATANKGNPLHPNGALSSFHADWVAASSTARFTSPSAALSFGGSKVPNTVLPLKPGGSGRHGVMESKAHDLIHVVVGSNDGNMGDPDTAARDPIFWLHHANVDRLWNRWLDIRGHQNPVEKEWLDQKFPFYDETGGKVELSVVEILELPGKSYRYDEEKRPLMVAGALSSQGKLMEATFTSVASVQPMLKLTTTTLKKTLSFDAANKPKMTTALHQEPAADTEPPAFVLEVEGIKPSKKHDIAFEVFVTKAGEKPTAQNYVGPITFFGRVGGGHGHGEGGFTQSFDVTDVLQKLRRANNGVLPDLDVSVVPHSTAGVSDADLAKQNIEIPISNISMKLVTEDKK